MIHRINIFLLSFIIALAPVYLFAGAAEKWDRLSLVYDAAGKVINVEHRKMILEAANDAVYKVKVPVTAAATGTTAASMIRFGLHGLAIAGVIEAMGWVIDEAGRVVKPPKENDPLSPPAPNVYGYWYALNGGLIAYCVGLSSCPGALTSLYAQTSPNLARVYDTCIQTGQQQAACRYNKEKDFWEYIYYQINPNYDPSIPLEPSESTPVSDTELGNAIIDSPSAPQILPDIYSPKNPIREQHPSAPAPAPTAVEDALDSANPTPSQDNPPTGSTSPKPAQDTDGDGVPDTVPEGSNFELPAFCSWAMAACDFFGVQKTDNKITHRKQDEQIANQEKQLEQDKTFFEKLEDWFTWSKRDDIQNQDDNVDIEEQLDTDILNKINSVQFNSSAYCPDDINIPVSFSGLGSTSLSISYTPLCAMAEQARPVVILMGWLMGAYIITGRNMREGD